MNKKILGLFLLSLAFAQNALQAGMPIYEESSTEHPPKRKESRLHHLAQTGDEKELQEALATKIYDVNAVDDQGNTPLHLAAQGGHISCCLLTLWRAGADRHRVNNDGDDVATVAEKNGHLELAQALREKYDNSSDDEQAEDNDTISPEDEDKLDALYDKLYAETPVRCAAPQEEHPQHHDSFDSLEKVLNEIEARQEQRKREQEESFNMAHDILKSFATNSHSDDESLDSLLAKIEIPSASNSSASGDGWHECGYEDGYDDWQEDNSHADFDTMPTMNNRPYSFICKGLKRTREDQDWLEQAENFFKQGRDVNEVLPCTEGKTPLHLAALHGFERTLQFLLDHKADVHVVDDNGWTPLHHAAHNNCDECVTKLLEAGADISLRTTAGLLPGSTPFELAFKNHHYFTAKLIDPQNFAANVYL